MQQDNPYEYPVEVSFSEEAKKCMGHVKPLSIHFIYGSIMAQCILHKRPIPEIRQVKTFEPEELRGYFTREDGGSLFGGKGGDFVLQGVNEETIIDTKQSMASFLLNVVTRSAKGYVVVERLSDGVDQRLVNLYPLLPMVSHENKHLVVGYTISRESVQEILRQKNLLK